MLMRQSYYIGKAFVNNERQSENQFNTLMIEKVIGLYTVKQELPASCSKQTCTFLSEFPYAIKYGR